jgi:hypothetical protein
MIDRELARATVLKWQTMTDIFEKFRTAQVEDLLANPHKFGAPSFEEFARNPDKWRARKDHWFEAVDKGSQMIGSVVSKQKYFVEGVPCATLEKCEQHAKDLGLSIEDLEPRPQMHYMGGRDWEIHINWVKKNAI